MKLITVGCALILTSMAFAQDMPKFDPSQMPSQADMQKMMQQAQKMQACMAEVDQAELQAMGERAKEVSMEIDGLCEKGDETGAIRTALEFSEEMQSNAAVQQARACAEDLPDMMKDMGLDFAAIEQQAEATESSICSVSR